MTCYRNNKMKIESGQAIAGYSIQDVGALIRFGFSYEHHQSLPSQMSNK
ncbi:hypothetical protein CQP30_08760 [Yersinia pestis]|uniref:Uncharacterized protein n=6 Tax=Yersinia pseudotuberculosis complex TaxID=1649845 RepID=A0A2U2GZ20_YERPE|nr:hypothetical protein YP_1523 [Yersinia pestis biovar Microtus str. 91001]ADV98958.1 hypothetical protein YPC_2388 [Yersinia pestis biovar Medievalis str. Harbin 35]AYW85169.1 hypothetical protein EGX42_20890 [Yersinia pestis]AYW93387.1 hypothetical protein EGX47_20075 [Yersinia pseudotuberculosis]EDM42672.1 hypothetical protein YPE_1386 [Yersinia pestis CA88-4125]EEO76331.1 hypothetical protein YP516_2529 [Yersinia pestis Nepal516]EEO81091.1 hypothetical protein YPF_2406 [Yersinia pestis b